MTEPIKPNGRAGEPVPGRLEMAARHFFGWVYTSTFAWLRSLPDDRAIVRARKFSKLFIHAEEVFARRNVPLANDPALAEEIHAGRFEYLSRLHVHIAKLQGAGPEGVLSQAVVSGEEHLVEALAQDKGVLMVSAHAGTWWHAPAVAASLGHPVSSVLTQHLPNAIVRYLEQVARELHCALTFVRMGAYEGAKAAFRQKGIFYLSFDFASRSDRSIWMPVGNHGVFPVDTGPGVMAVRHQVPVVWVDTWHDEQGRSNIRFLPAIQAGKGTGYSAPGLVLEYFRKRLADQLSRNPQQWWLLGHGHLKARSEIPADPVFSSSQSHSA
ncbi:hypothetical protein KBB96_19000 [Luteolibacter ambystomatis]|uniref:Lipid A biosynthesis acyltransferase n=1 Tax=Luteolibacter ambystomatis TaxID=2824561 RepID=A0A975G8A9_9BACT|nr:hypothetical protein [Luteolibacter ambystomatis]QUE50934.1 hypothetical protein KBB96_19000 [Luteolibacter ambystomatis]